MSLDCEGKQSTQRENLQNSTQKSPSCPEDSNPGLSCCEGTKLTTLLPKRYKKWSEMKPKPFFKHLKHVISGNLLLQDLAHWCGDNNWNLSGNISFPTFNHWTVIFHSEPWLSWFIGNLNLYKLLETRVAPSLVFFTSGSCRFLSYEAQPLGEERSDVLVVAFSLSWCGRCFP